MIKFQILDDYYFNDAFLKVRLFYVKLTGGLNRTIMITFPAALAYRECVQLLPIKIAEKINEKFTN